MTAPPSLPPLPVLLGLEYNRTTTTVQVYAKPSGRTVYDLPLGRLHALLVKAHGFEPRDGFNSLAALVRDGSIPVLPETVLETVLLRRLGLQAALALGRQGA